VADSENKEVLVKALLTREGDVCACVRVCVCVCVCVCTEYVYMHF
jgi:hypothetical protein